MTSSHGKIRTSKESRDSPSSGDSLNLEAIEETLNCLNQGIGLFSGDFRLFLFNRKFAELLDLPPDLAKAGPLLDDVARFTAGTGRGNRNAATPNISERLDHARKGEPFGFEHTRPDGTVIQVRDTPLPGGGLVTTCTDVTEHKHAEGSLADSEQQVRAILEHTAEGFITIGVDGTVTTFNPAAEKLFGYSADEMIGKNVSLLMEDADAKAHDGYVRKYIETQKAKIIGIGPREVTAKRKDGTVFPIALNVREFFQGGDRRFIGTLRDITEQKAVEDALTQHEEDLKRQIVELRDQEERLEAQGMELVELAEGASTMRDELDTLNKQKDKFFSIIAHDLKSPFNALLGFSSILQSRGAELDKQKVAEYGNLIHQAAGQAFKLLEDLLDWARLQMGRMDYDPQSLDIADEFDNSISLFQSAARAKNIELKSDSKTGLNVHADRYMVDAILRNLVNNAIKFTPEDGEVTLSARPSGQWVEVRVTDNGVGIPADKLNRLFHIEEKTTTKGTAGETGTGLGLHLCKELVEKHGGEIAIDSIEGTGSTFRFTLPAAE